MREGVSPGKKMKGLKFYIFDLFIYFFLLFFINGLP